MPLDAAPIDGTKVRLLTLGDLDRRTSAVRRARELIAAVTDDLGGVDRLSVAQQQVIQRASLLGVLTEDLESRWLRGEAIDPLVLATLGNAQRRMLETIGFARAATDVTPTLSQYLKDRG